MNLEDYLAELEACPDEELTSKLGVYDNFFILLKKKFLKIVSDLRSAGYEATGSSEKGTGYILTNASRTVSILIKNQIAQGFTTDFGANIREEGVKHQKRQLKAYNTTISLHVDERAGDPSQMREIANVIKDLGRYIIEQRIPACFSQSVGSDDIADYSRIVYHRPGK